MCYPDELKKFWPKFVMLVEHRVVVLGHIRSNFLTSREALIVNKFQTDSSLLCRRTLIVWILRRTINRKNPLHFSDFLRTFIGDWLAQQWQALSKEHVTSEMCA